jgi:ABC-type nitrate/sulfonate/bicarbonate transport system, ATPase component
MSPSATERSSAAALLTLQGVGKRFERRSGKTITYTHALRDINIDVRNQEFLAIIGPSGCGKTTLIRLVAGLLPYTSGSIRLDGTPVTGPGADRAMVFQSANLLPWRTVIKNVELGLEQRRVPAKERRERAREVIELVGLADFEDHYPRELSGGMQQRVGLARALAVNPKVLLMDEPFGALDAITRKTMQDELLRLWNAERKTVVFITHAHRGSHVAL